MSSLSNLANTLIPSEIIKLGNEINELKKQGQKIFNFTIGDFDPSIYPIPSVLEKYILDAYKLKKTNYPPAAGLFELRNAVSHFLKRKLNLSYNEDEILISGGGRPIIYAAYRTICDAQESIIYPVPSWNNNHYTHFVEGKHICIETSAENYFLPTAAQLIPHFKDAVLLSLCSPLNPTGTLFSQHQLKEICEAIVEENKNRGTTKKPLYLLYDQIYWSLTHGESKHVNPVTLCPDIAPYTILVDGISKAFCATGVRVGWACAPANIIHKMKGILSHIGAWSPMAEQWATAQFLKDDSNVDQFINDNNEKISYSLHKIYEGVVTLKNQGYAIDAIPPKAAMYLSIQFSLKGKIKENGEKIISTQDMSDYLLQEAKLAIVPFSAFGMSAESDWYRLSVGTCNIQDIDGMFVLLKNALNKLK